MTRLHPRAGRPWLVVAIAIGWSVAASVAPAPSAAYLSDQDASTVAISTGTLAPPTGLAATGGTSVALTWTPGVTSGTSGYEVWRGTTSGGAYGLVSTVTPGSAASGADAPATSGVYYYVLRSILQNWRSVNSNQASATVSLGAVATGYVMCGASVADTGGDGNGYETATISACADDGVNAIDVGTGTAGRTAACVNPANDRHRFAAFVLGVPLTASAINGIEVRADVGLNNNGGTSRMCVELSWNGGLTWTAAKVLPMTTSAQTIYTFGGAADTWGRTWTAAELTAATFVVRVTDATTQPNKDYRLDFLAAQVTYAP